MTINASAINNQAINAFDSSQLISLSTALSSSSSCSDSVEVICARGLVSTLGCGSSTSISGSSILRGFTAGLESLSISPENVNQIINRDLSTTVDSASFATDSTLLVPIKTLISTLNALSAGATPSISIERLFASDFSSTSLTPNTVFLIPNGFLKLISALSSLSETTESSAINVKRAVETLVASVSVGVSAAELVILHRAISSIQSLSGVSYRTRILQEVVAAIRSKMNVNVGLKKPRIEADANRPNLEARCGSVSTKESSKVPSLTVTSF